MSRPIKFRAWDKRNNKMLQWGNLLHMYNTLICLSFNFFKIMQYTGLKDNKRTEQYPEGQEIYEGDILKINRWKPKTGVVEFIEGGFCVVTDSDRNYTHDINIFYPSVGCQIEVVGNIYENPELSKEDE